MKNPWKTPSILFRCYSCFQSFKSKHRKKQSQSQYKLICLSFGNRCNWPWSTVNNHSQAYAYLIDYWIRSIVITSASDISCMIYLLFWTRSILFHIYGFFLLDLWLMTDLRNSQEVRGIQERNSVSKCVGMGKEYHQLRPDVVLPQEWTYWAQLGPFSDAKWSCSFLKW